MCMYDKQRMSQHYEDWIEDTETVGLRLMPSPHPAVTPAAIAITLKYGKSVSKGIKEMEQIIQGQTMALNLMRDIQDNERVPKGWGS
jgi:hypothetical protein